MVHRVKPTFSERCLLRRQKKTHRCREESHMELVAEAGVMQPQAMGCWSPQQLGEAKRNQPGQHGETQSLLKIQK